jgi:DNA primase
LKAASAGIAADMLETVGLIARRNEGRGYYDRFRDRVIFPIRDVTGRTVGFGGRILPSSPVSADRPPPKYYNSAETALFSKSENLYGIEQAKQAAHKAGYLAIVEGYTDVLMAHQHGIGQVVATMGTALNARHIKKLKGVTPRVVLVFDADAGGDAGVDRALEIFVSNDLDLRIATLPEGLDPCDLLSTQGPGAVSPGTGPGDRRVRVQAASDLGQASRPGHGWIAARGRGDARHSGPDADGAFR